MAPLAPAEPLKLSEERRKKLLTAFIIPPLKAKDLKPQRKLRFRLAEVLALITLIALLAAMLLPGLGVAKEEARLLSRVGSTTPDGSAVLEEFIPVGERVNFRKYLEQSQRRLADNQSLKAGDDMRIIENRVQISGQIAPTDSLLDFSPAAAPPARTEFKLSFQERLNLSAPAKGTKSH
jgi:hypothetical protein